MRDTLLTWSILGAQKDIVLFVGLPPIPDFWHAVPRPGKTSLGTANVPDFKMQSK